MTVLTREQSERLSAEIKHYQAEERAAETEERRKHCSAVVAGIYIAIAAFKGGAS